MARRRKKNNRKAFWAVVLTCSVLAAACLLITLSETMDPPLLPTWKEIFQAVGVTDPEPLDTEMEVHVIDVGNADAILVRNQGKNLLIDAGERDDGDRVVAYLRQKGIGRLDMLIASHADADHIGGMKTVVEEMEIGTFLMAFMPEGHTPTTKTYENLLNAVAVKGLVITPAEAGDRYALGDAELLILGPVGDFEDNNNQSVVCKVTFGARKFLFMGDAEKEAEDALIHAGSDLSADFLKVGHHGSNTSTQERLLQRVSPKIAVISCGADNSYGHPHSEVLDRLEQRHITVYRSDRNGHIQVTTDGATLTVTTEK